MSLSSFCPVCGGGLACVNRCASKYGHREIYPSPCPNCAALTAERDAARAEAQESATKVIQLEAQINGPDGFATWNDAAVHERMLRVKAEAEVDLLRGAMTAQDDRERQAGEKCGVDYATSGCDWPDAVADRVLHLRAEVERLTAFKQEWDEKDGNSPGYNLTKAKVYGNQALKYKKQSDTLRKDLDRAVEALAAHIAKGHDQNNELATTLAALSRETGKGGGE